MTNHITGKEFPGAELTTEQQQIKDHQKEVWNKFSPGWKKWDDFVIEFLKPQGDEMIRLLDPKENELILDIASGTGDPGLAIAALVKGGKVILTDLSEGMLEVANENAVRKGITNIETMLCDACNLPFADNTFDSISCRLGFMFFPDMEMAAKEFHRVLKPGGKIATTVWGAPDKNFWATSGFMAVNKNMNIPAPPPGTPGLYRCAEKGLISGLLSNVGFKNVSESEVGAKFDAKTTEVHWTFLTEVVAPVVNALSKADDEMKAKIKAEVAASVLQRYPEGEVVIDGLAHVIYGEK